MNNYEINVFYLNCLLFKCTHLFYPTDKKIGRLDTDDLDEIEKIANWSDEERNALYIIFIKISSAVTSSDLMLE